MLAAAVELAGSVELFKAVAGWEIEGTDSVFLPQKVLQLERKYFRHFLPSEYFAADAQIDRPYAPHDCIPGFAQVGTAGIRHDAEGALVCVRSQDIANELIAEIVVAAAREIPSVENFAEVLVRNQDVSSLGLKICFGELGFDEQVSNPEIDFCAIELVIG